MEPYPLCFIDLETTGNQPLMYQNGINLLPLREIIEIGLVMARQSDLEIMGTFEVKVRPRFPGRYDPYLVNDFPNRFARGEWNEALELSDALRNMFNFVERHNVPCIPVGQNPSFDWSFLKVAASWAFSQNFPIFADRLKKCFHYSPLDTRSMAAQTLLGKGGIYHPDEFSVRSGRIAEQLGIEPESYPHKALNGALHVYNIYRKLRSLHPTKEEV